MHGINNVAAFTSHQNFKYICQEVNAIGIIMSKSNALGIIMSKSNAIGIIGSALEFYFNFNFRDFNFFLF